MQIAIRNGYKEGKPSIDKNRRKYAVPLTGDQANEFLCFSGCFSARIERWPCVPIKHLDRIILDAPVLRYLGSATDKQIEARVREGLAEGARSVTEVNDYFPLDAKIEFKAPFDRDQW